MSPAELLVTAPLLGAFVLLAGAYGLLYGMGQLRRRRDLVLVGFAAYAVQCIVLVAVLVFTPLLAWWKIFIALSCAIYLAIPPVTWRYLSLLHHLEERET